MRLQTIKVGGKLEVLGRSRAYRMLAKGQQRDKFGAFLWQLAKNVCVGQQAKTPQRNQV